jgi:IPT/TIG domain-containing protein
MFKTAMVAPAATSSGAGGAEWFALGTLVILVVVVLVTRAFLSRPKPEPPAGGTPPKPTFILIGHDNRISTSKTVAAAWTLVLAFMVLAILYSAIGQPGSYLQTAFNKPNNSNLLYLILLGGPYAAAVLAKAAVSTQVNNRTLQKTSGTPDPLDVITDDSGATDLYDLQYTLFNLVVMIAVLALFIPAPSGGLPTIPDFLAMLTGGSALTYTLNKATGGNNQATLTSVVPKRARVGDQVSLYGQNLAVLADNQKDVIANTAVMVGGQTVCTITDAQPDHVAFKLPKHRGTPWPGADQDVEVKTNGNADAKLPGALTIIGEAPTIAGVDPPTILASKSPSFTVRGSFFCSTDPTTDNNADTPAVVLTVGTARMDCKVTNSGDPNRDTQLVVQVPAELRSKPPAGPAPATVSVTRGDNATTSIDVSVDQ